MKGTAGIDVRKVQVQLDTEVVQAVLDAAVEAGILQVQTIAPGWSFELPVGDVIYHWPQ